MDANKNGNEQQFIGVDAAMLNIVTQIGEIKGMIERHNGVMTTLDERMSGRIGALEMRVSSLEGDKSRKANDGKHWQIIAGTLMGGLAGSVLQWVLSFTHR